MHHLLFLQDLAVVMIVAGFVTILFRQFKQPVVLGYILAGVIIGPHTPPFPMIADKHTVETLSELGVIFLMFALGLEFHLRKLKEVGSTAFIAAAFEILLMVWVGYQLGVAFGWNLMDSVFLGAILAISSTTIIIKALEELGKTKERFAELIFGILIVEDILAIVMIALLSGFAATGQVDAATVGDTVVKLGSFLVVLLVAGLIAVPRLLNYVARFKSNEMLLITVLALCFGVSLVTVKLGYSVALGAFLIGAIVAEARQIAKIEMLMEPVRDMFSAVFFVSIGLLIDPAMLLKYIWPILAISAAVIIGKVIACSAGAFVSGNDRKTSLRIGMGLAQIGEFSFIIAALGLTLKVTSDFVYPIAVAVSAITTLATPYLIRSSDGVVGWFDRLAPRPVSELLDAYTRWIGELGKGRRTNHAAKFVRKWAWQIALNLLLITAVFIGISFLKAPALARWPTVPGGEPGMKAICWLGAMLVSLPILIAAVRKWQALCMLLSEMSVTRAAGGKNTEAWRAVVSTTLFAAGCAGLMLLILVLSSTILPSWNVLIVLGLVLIGATLLLRRAFIRLYSKAQGALQETFAQPPAPRHHETVTALPSLLREAELKVVPIDTGSVFAGRFIADAMLRTRTGASIVGIERESANVINPGPDEELQPGDRLLMIGSVEQLAAAESLLTAKA